MGAVNHPGVHQLEGHKTLVEAISLAEGLRPDAGPALISAGRYSTGRSLCRLLDPTPAGKYSVADIGVKDLLSGTHPAENIVVFPERRDYCTHGGGGVRDRRSQEAR